jgi:predicted flap endonuclease-1-like 5' DNA nuclease
MVRSFARLVLAALLALPASQALAAHYYLQDVEMFDSYAEAFATQSFATTRDVLVAVVTPEQRATLSETTGVPVQELATIARFLELLQIDGVGPRAARLLQAGGVTSAADLAARSPAELLALLETTNAGFIYTSAHPSMHHVQGWIYEASRVEFTVVD